MIGRILIIESEPSLSQKIRAALGKASFDVVDVPNFPEALLKLSEFKPDLVITDEVLPGGDGMEACRQLHNILGIPIIMIGKQSGSEIWERAVDAGADFYLTKPFSNLMLVARVKAILRCYRRLEVAR